MKDHAKDFTLEALEGARAYRAAALADGWTSEPTCKQEEEECASQHHREGFHMSIIAPESRPATKHLIEQRRPEGSVSIWGPDGLAIAVPMPYSWGALVAGMRICGACGKTDVDTQRFSFAGRCCAVCLPEMRRKHEYPGWTN